MQFRLSNSQRYLVVGLVGLELSLTITIRVSRLALWLVLGLALTKYRYECDNLANFCVSLNSVKLYSEYQWAGLWPTQYTRTYSTEENRS